MSEGILHEALALKKKIELAKKKVKELEEEYGIDVIKEEIIDDQEDLIRMLIEAHEKEITAEGSVVFVDSSIRKRVVIPEKFVEDYPDMALRCCTVSVTKVEKEMVKALTNGGMGKGEAEQAVSETLGKYIEYKVTEKFDVMDLAGE
jgi:hypothetical protein